MERGEFQEYFKADKWKQIEEPYMTHSEEQKGTPKDSTVLVTDMNNRQKQVLQHSGNTLRANSDVYQIFIARSLAVEETQNRFLSRIPFRRNEYLWIDKNEISHISEEKRTIFANLKKDKEYSIVNGNGRVVGRRTGEQLYSQSYDPVLKETRDMLYRKKQENQKAHKLGSQIKRREGR